MPKRIIVEVVQHLRPGGLEHIALDLAVFSSGDRQTFLVSLEGSSDVDGVAWDRLRGLESQTIFIGKEPGFRPAIINNLRKLFRHLNADVVHTHHLGPLIYGGIAARLAGVKTIVHTEHNAWHLDQPRRRRLQGIAMKWVRPVVVADARTVARSLTKAFPNLKPMVILNGIDTRRFRPGEQADARFLLGLPATAMLIGCAARLEAVKGHRILLSAIKTLPETIHLALAGDGSLRQALSAEATALGIRHRVHFLGCLERMEIFYQALDLFCLPSLNEGFPLAPLEAQACGIPSVVSDVGACREAVDPAAGCIVPPGNAAALADAITETLGRKSASPREFITAKADVRKMVSAYEELYG